MSLAKLVETAVDATHDSWCRYAMSRLRRREDAEDAVQDAVVRTLRANPQLNSYEQARRYIWTVLRRTSVRVVGISRSRTMPLEEEAAAAPDCSYSRSPLDIALAKEAAEEKARVLEFALSGLDELSEERRQAIELLVLQDPPLKLREVAEMQGVAISTVHNRVQRGARELGLSVGRTRKKR